ncbi:MAG TPA: metallophosphoesterase [Thermomicrobiales bacterium]|jgi:hypothetical protein|nr:metallophosphoesterase [Thermomicrobiales bacterium]
MSDTPLSPVRVAILSDVHGNDHALRAVLAALATVPHDAIVVAGDHVWGGPSPRQCLDLLRELGAPMLRGNTDEYLWLPPRFPEMARTIAWATAQLGDDGVAFLRALPIGWRTTPPGGRTPEDDLLVVHATPTDNDAELILEPDPFGNLPVTPPDVAQALIGDARAGLIVAGHLHYISSGEIEGQRLASVGSVGSPLDGDPRAAWGVATWDGSAWTLEHHRTPYDVEAAARATEAAAPQPMIGRVLGERLRQARWLPFEPTGD